MQLRAMQCTNCGGTLPPRSRWSVIDCSYCGTRLVLDGSSLVRRADYKEALRVVVESADASGAVVVGGGRYRVHGRLGQGESTDVFLAERLGPSELVVLKVQRAGGDADMLQREHDVLGALSRGDAQGTPYFSTQIPQTVGFGRIETGSPAKTLALIHRHRSGFVETLSELEAAFPGGLDARHAVWILGRVLEVAGWVHRSGFIHGAILPQHLLINARDHGVMLLGWSCAMPPGKSLPARSSASEEFYPEEVAGGKGVSAFTDLVMVARCVAHALTGDARRLGSAPRPLLDLLEPYVAGDASRALTANARELKDALGRAAVEAFGPPQYVPLMSPRWAQAAAALRG